MSLIAAPAEGVEDAFRATRWAYGRCLASGFDRLVLIAAANHADAALRSNNGYGSLDVETLVAELGVLEWDLRPALAFLVSEGLLVEYPLGYRVPESAFESR